MSIDVAQDNSLEYPFYYKKSGDVPFWDHPLMSGYKKLPNNYSPHVTLESVLTLYLRRRIDDLDFTILKVLGDAVCCTEDQLRRYLSSEMSRSQVSKRLNKLRTFGLADRWSVQIQMEEMEDIKPSAPFTLGIAGFKLMKHFYNDHYFMKPDRWEELGIGAIQRYVAMNELRCRFTELKISNFWTWNPVINQNTKLRKPFSVTGLDIQSTHLNFFIERLQMKQDFVGFTKGKLHQWKTIYDKHDTFPIYGIPPNPFLVILYASTLSMAETVHKNLVLDQYPFKIWLCIEEDFQDGLSTSFYKAEKTGLKRVRLPYFEAESV